MQTPLTGLNQQATPQEHTPLQGTNMGWIPGPWPFGESMRPGARSLPCTPMHLHRLNFCIAINFPCQPASTTQHYVNSAL